MDARRLYERLDADFEVERFTDEWGQFLDVNKFVNPAFTERWIGVMLDNAEQVNKVYTCVFPDGAILDEVLRRGETDLLIFAHHAMGYDPRMEGLPFYNMDLDHLEQLQSRRISFYVMHVPLDHNGWYSTSVSLARAMEFGAVEGFCEYLGCKVGVICETPFSDLQSLAAHAANVVGHRVSLRRYGRDRVEDGIVAVAAGGGCIDFVARELVKLGVGTFLTGVSRPTEGFAPGMEFHRIAAEAGINILGATHYSTEKYACMAMVDYFAKNGVDAEFLEGEPFLEDL